MVSDGFRGSQSERPVLLAGQPQHRPLTIELREGMNSLVNHGCTWVALVVVVAGCSKSPSPARQASELEAVFQRAVAAQPVSNRELVEQALAAIRAKDYVGAVVRLNVAKRNSELRGEQRMELEQAGRAVSAQLTARALRGDQSAVADLQAIEEAMNSVR